MKELNDYLDDAVKRKSEYSKDFKELLIKYKQGDCVRVFVESVIEEAMAEYGKQVAIAQRDACLNGFNRSWPAYNQISERILKTKLVVD